MRRDSNDPSGLAWLVASISLVLPLIGLSLAGYGGIAIARGLDNGWIWLAAGLAVLMLDVCIDFIWAHPSVSRSDQPELNRKGHQLAGRIAVVVAPFVAGRGKVRIDDSEWLAEGCDCPAGSRVRVLSATDAVLRVEAE